MPEAGHPTRTIELERKILNILTADPIEPKDWIEIERELGAYGWRETDHVVIFQAILRVRKRGAKIALETLAAETTRMGFPDLNWRPFFETQPAAASQPELQHLIGQLEIDSDQKS